MNTLSTFAGQQVWHIAGWTMLHYLWLGALVAVLAIVARLLLRRAAANLRYAVALCCLLLLAALPVGIATWLTISTPFQNPPLAVAERRDDGDLLDKINDRAHAADHIAQPIIELNERDPAPTDSSAPGSAGGLAADEQPWHDEPYENIESQNPRQSRGLFAFRDTLESCVPYLPWLWIIGTPITFALLATGIIGTKRLRNAGRAIDDPRIVELMTRLTTSLRIGRRVTVALCERIASPVLIGILRPVILLPPAALSGWSPDEIEMVLLHELAHVRRWDNLVNLLQRIIESLLFFHPAVWLISTWVRRERESCCDAFVVRRTERPHAYAELLLSLASPQPLAGLAFARHPLRNRIRRILQLEEDPMLISGKSLTLTFAVLLAAATLALLYLPTIGQAEESTTEVTEVTEKKKHDDTNRADTKPSEETILGDGIRATAREIEVKENGSVFLKGVRTIEQVESTADEKKALQEIAELLKRKAELEAQLYELQTHFTVLKGRLAEKDQNQPNSELQQLTKEFQVNSGALKKQLTALNEALAEKMETIDEIRTSQTIELKPDAPDTAASENAPQANSEEPQVVATLSVDAFNTNEFKQAYEAARKNKQYVDMLYRDNGSVLVIVPEPTEANWPDVLGNVPRKERVIAEKAYARLGLKLAPLTNAEAAYRQVTGRRTGVQIVGGNVPQGLPLPATLTSVGGKSVSNMDELLTWLESERGLRADSVKCNASADDNEYLFESVIAEEKLSISQDAPTELTMPPGPTAPAKAAFPSLEDQKLTDLVWKRLRLEMESIDEKELELVKALGYDGGLKVSAGIAGLPFSGAGVGENIGPGDILVGLHVWPTTTMKELVAILNRDDLAELGPLKFYVIRQGDGHGASGERVVTGRVSVTQAAPSASTSRSSPQPAPQPPALPGVPPLEPQSSRPSTKGSQKNAPTPQSAPPNELGDHDGSLILTLRNEHEPILNRDLNFLFFHSPTSQPSKEMQPIVEKMAKQFPAVHFHLVDASQASPLVDEYDVDKTPTCLILRNGNVISKLVGLLPEEMIRKNIEASVESVVGQTPQAPNNPPTDLPRYETPPPETEAADAPKPRSKRLVAAAGAAPTMPEARLQPESLAKARLRYDGRPFEQWQQDWLNRRQLDALKALEAFSAAGYSHEAADTILYGLYSDDDSVAQHSRKYLSRLPADVRPTIVTRLIDVLNTDLSANRRVAAARALAAIGTHAEPALEVLKKSMGSDDLQERIASATAIKMILGKDKYQKPVAEVLGEELGITVVEASHGVWGALPRADVKDDGEAFNKFTEAVIEEQQKLFPKN